MLFTLYSALAMTTWMLVRAARKDAGLTQAALASRAGTTQTAIARLERPGSNPRLTTLERVLGAAGHRLRLESAPGLPDEDETLIESHVRMSPAERAANHDAGYRNLRDLVMRARRVDD
jgi:transcriptional regulator with XRE-family HTH domain